MKKTLLAAVMAVFAMTASAQIYVGGQIGFSTSSVNADTEGSSSISGTSFKILPEVGYKLNDKWAVGIQVGYSQGISAFGTFDVNDFRSLAKNVGSAAFDVLSSSDLADVKLNSFRVAPYVRYTFLKAGNFDFFLEGGVAYTNIKAKNVSELISQIPDDPTINAFEIAVRPGITFNINQNAQVVAKIGALGYQNATLDMGMGSKPSINRFGLEVDGDDLSLGFNYQF
ncbi:MAG: outer membrane beta-barrel protein [Prevotella sp.]|nr:outer membrane beta-barrel protein [Prevotella sp.]